MPTSTVQVIDQSSRSENKKVVEAVGVTSSEGFSSSTPVGLIELCAGAGGIDVDFDTATKRRLTDSHSLQDG